MPRGPYKPAAMFHQSPRFHASKSWKAQKCPKALHEYEMTRAQHNVFPYQVVTQHGLFELIEVLQSAELIRECIYVILGARQALIEYSRREKTRICGLII